LVACLSVSARRQRTDSDLKRAEKPRNRIHRFWDQERNRWQLQGALAINTAQRPRGTGGCPPNPPNLLKAAWRSKSFDKTWQRQWGVRQRASTRDWLLGALRKGSAGHP